MTLKCYQLCLDKVTPTCRDVLISDSAVVKHHGQVRHGTLHSDIVVGGSSLFETTLEKGRAIADPVSVTIREDHPQFAWVLLNSQ